MAPTDHSRDTDHNALLNLQGLRRAVALRTPRTEKVAAFGKESEGRPPSPMGPPSLLKRCIEPSTMQPCSEPPSPAPPVASSSASSSATPSHHNHTDPVLAAVLGSLLGLLALGVLIFCALRFHKRQKQKAARKRATSIKCRSFVGSSSPGLGGTHSQAGTLVKYSDASCTMVNSAASCGCSGTSGATVASCACECRLLHRIVREFDSLGQDRLFKCRLHPDKAHILQMASTSMSASCQNQVSFSINLSWSPPGPSGALTSVIALLHFPSQHH